MKLLDHPYYKFDRTLPLFNWMYPLQNQAPQRWPAGSHGHQVFDDVDPTSVKSRALYFHVPFCTTICSFCPFVRGGYRDDDMIETYVKALIREIDIKGRYDAVASVPIGAVFFGGGTPSLLTPDQIRRIGEAIHRHFDVGCRAEFSFEMEAKSITIERVRALREIGATHARFGVQTFNETYRSLFTLTATVDDLKRGSSILVENMPFVSFDLLYGMNGQTVDELIDDLDEGIALETNNIDLYPIDDVVTQVRLHRAFAAHRMPPTSGVRKLEMKLLAADYLRAACFVPHNGHGFVRVSSAERDRTDVVSDAYSFRYHEHVYGYADRDVVGFGTGAVSLLQGLSVTNVERRQDYVAAVLERGDWEIVVSPQDERAQQSRGVIMHLPYHGELSKQRTAWQDVYPETLRALAEAIRHGLVVDSGNHLRISRAGWYWYVELMYYLMPRDQQKVLDAFIDSRLRQSSRTIGSTRVSFHPRPIAGGLSR